MTTARGTAGGPAGPDPAIDIGRTEWIALTVISVAQMMFLIDATIVNIALPGIRSALGFSGAGLEWVVTSYSLVFGGLLLLGGRAGDVLGRRRIFVAGLALFTVASLVGGFATAPWWLLACRAAQAVGAAAASPAALSLIATTFREGPARNRAVSVYTALATAGGGIGLLAGGLITSYLSWRWVMFVNVPFGAVMILLAPRVLRESDRRGRRFDLPGAVTGTLGVTLLVYALIRSAADRSGRPHWSDPPVLTALAGAVVLIIAFIAIERRSPHPLVPLRIFASALRTGTYLVMALTSTAMFGIFFFSTLFLQQVWHYGPLHTALVYLPSTGLLVYGARASGRLLPRLGARTLVLGGLALASVGMLWLSRIGESGGYLTGMLVPVSLTYLGLGLTGVPLTLGALNGVHERDAGAASGLCSAARQIGGATGLAVLGTVTWTTVAAAVIRPDSPAGGRTLADQALATGVDRGFVAATGLTVLALVVAAATMRRDRPTADGRLSERLAQERPAKGSPSTDPTG